MTMKHNQSIWYKYVHKDAYASDLNILNVSFEDWDIKDKSDGTLEIEDWGKVCDRAVLVTNDFQLPTDVHT